MTAKIYSSTAIGHDGEIITIECDLLGSTPKFIVVGLGAKAIDESRERVRSALKNTGFQIPRKRIVVNLAPADIPKDGTIYDLPIAISILEASGLLSCAYTEKCHLIGELSLDGSIKPVKGIINHLEIARRNNFKISFIPYENYHQAKLISGIKIIPVKNFAELCLLLERSFDYLNKYNFDTDYKISRKEMTLKTRFDTIDFKDIHGQENCKRALEIAATGCHNILMSGSPGAGKTMMAKALLSILPNLSEEEVVEITKIYSIAGESNNIIETRPFRSPHHTASSTSIVGGGKIPRPGEISLAHRGVLFLDEIPEFSRYILESLRQPMEDRYINISRANRSIRYPSDFMLVATQNPCPCGYALDNDRECKCNPFQIQNYSRKLSGPLLDRIDIQVNVSRLDHSGLLKDSNSKEGSLEIKGRVEKARQLQRERFKSETITNANMNNKQIKELCNLQQDSKELLDLSAHKLSLSARSYMKIIKVSRTIADLSNSKAIKPNHIAEALQFRIRT
jgi:magnesium chelatase family protein